MKRATSLIFVTAALFLFLQVGIAEHAKQNTGILKAKAFDSGANLYISQTNSPPTKIGVGVTSVRLKPGTYRLMAAKDHLQSFANITIQKSKVTSKTLGQPTRAKFIQDNSLANSFIELLPYTGPGNEYEVSYSYTYASGVAIPKIIVLASTQAAKSDAQAWIKSVGFDPGKLPISYVEDVGQ